MKLTEFDESISLKVFYSDLLAEQQKLSAVLEEMKNQAHEKTVRYREMFGQKLINKAMLESIELYVKSKESPK